MTNPTNDPVLRSFVSVDPQSHFPIQNLPYGVFKRSGGAAGAIGVAIGEAILDLSVIARQGLLDSPALPREAFTSPTLNHFMSLGPRSWHEARTGISRLLSTQESTLRDNASLQEQALVLQREVTMMLPAEIGDYTDFYSSKEHASNVGSMFRGPANALMPNWVHLPVAYHGRASSVVVSGTGLHRPWGQTKSEEASGPSFGPSQRLDFELEVGCFIGPGNELGQAIPVHRAQEHLFGLVLVNDWSARDIQQWEYVPLGPFLAKNFGTSVSPWVVTLEALEPFRCPGPAQEPTPLPYLQSKGDWAIDIELEIYLEGEHWEHPQRISATNFKTLYWNLAQQVAHHTATGCNLRPGDLLASGTISGLSPGSYGSMLELAWRGSRPLDFPNGDKRSFLEDGDRVTMTGWCQGNGYRVGFGEVTGKVLPALG
jgi:fumarylacetoacetase